MIIQPMARRTLIDVFQDFALVDSEFIVHDDGYRTRRWTYAQVAGAARSFAARLESAGIGVDQKVVIWGENSPEWIAVLWGACSRVSSRSRSITARNLTSSCASPTSSTPARS